MQIWQIDLVETAIRPLNEARPRRTKRFIEEISMRNPHSSFKKVKHIGKSKYSTRQSTPQAKKQGCLSIDAFLQRLPMDGRAKLKIRRMINENFLKIRKGIPKVKRFILICRKRKDSGEFDSVSFMAETALPRTYLAFCDYLKKFTKSAIVSCNKDPYPLLIAHTCTSLLAEKVNKRIIQGSYPVSDIEIAKGFVAVKRDWARSFHCEMVGILSEAPARLGMLLPMLPEDLEA